MIKSIIDNEQVGSYSRRQQLFLKYTFLILIDLTVLNFFNQFWDNVYIEHFSISLLAAILLQILLQITLVIEHKVANYFKEKSTLTAKILRGFATWLILFISKFIILEALNVALGDSLMFSGYIDGLVAFIVVVTVMIITEQLFSLIYRKLA